MLGIEAHAAELVRALDRRSGAVVAALSAASDDSLRGDSLLPGWSRLTIACHLRYGAGALRTMTEDAIAGRAASYYPLGRARQRPSTLEPADGEAPGDVIRDLAGADAELVACWRELAPATWHLEVLEPPGNVDLGPVTLGVLAMSALTEREVHGTDLDLGLPDWSAEFVARVLPARLAWLATRRTNHRAFDRSIRTSWLLVATDADLRHRIDLDDTADADDDVDDVTTTIEGSSRDLLALLLGRPRLAPLGESRPGAVADFERAFPGP